MESLDLEAYRLPATPLDAQPKRKFQNRQTGRFIQGPISMDWVSRVANLPGKAPTLVGLMLFHLAGLKKTQERLPLCAKQMRQFGIRNVQTVRKALDAMQTAGLVALEHHPGRCRLVTITSIVPTDCVAEDHQPG